MSVLCTYIVRIRHPFKQMSDLIFHSSSSSVYLYMFPYLGSEQRQRSQNETLSTPIPHDVILLNSNSILELKTTFGSETPFKKLALKQPFQAA